MCRNDRRSDPKVRQPSSDHIGINWFLAIPIEIERADTERLVKVADHMSQHPKCLPLAQDRRALVWSSVAQDVDALFGDLHYIVTAGPCCSQLVLLLLEGDIRVMKDTMLRIVLHIVLFIG